MAKRKSADIFAANEKPFNIYVFSVSGMGYVSVEAFTDAQAWKMLRDNLRRTKKTHGYINLFGHYTEELFKKLDITITRYVPLNAATHTVHTEGTAQATLF